MTAPSRACLLGISAVCLLASCSSTPTHHRSGPLKTLRQASPTSAPGTTTSVHDNSSTAAWLTYGRENERSGYDPSSPPVSDPRPAWTSIALDGSVYAEPLLVGSSVIVATENNTVYSLDIPTGKVNWSRHLATPVSGGSLPCGNIDPSGITGTPAADPATQSLWVVSFSAPPAHTLWQLDLASGRVVDSRAADPPGADPATEQQRGALTLSSGKVYIPYGGLYGDCGNYHGWLVAFGSNSTVPSTTDTYETPAEHAGIWAPPGAAVDSSGDLFVATGNGVPAAVAGDANSVIKLDPSLKVLARFTAPDYQQLSQTDTDLGSISPVILSGGSVLQVGKEGVGYLLPPNLGSPMQTFQACSGAFGAAAVDGDNIYISCFDGLYALTISNASHAASRWSVTGIKPGPPTIAGGLVWTVNRDGAVEGYSQKTGAKVYSYPVSVAGSFPTVSSFGGRLFVADGKRVIAFSGI